MRITSAFLREYNACENQASIFDAEWPTGAELTLPNLLRAVELGLDIEWLVPCIDFGPPAVFNQEDRYLAYYAAVMPAYEKYNSDTRRPVEAYDKYDGAIIAAVTNHWNAMGIPAKDPGAWFESLVPAHEALRAALAAHKIVLNTAIAHALIGALE